MLPVPPSPPAARAAAGSPEESTVTGLDHLNSAPPAAAEGLLLTCCASRRWARTLVEHRPYPDTAALLAAAEEAGYDLAPDDVAEALAGESTPGPAGLPGLSGPPAAESPAAHAAGFSLAGAPQPRTPAETGPGRGTAPSGAPDPATRPAPGTRPAPAPRRPGMLAAHTALRAAHAAYESRFGHAFVICLDGVAPEESLDHVLAGIRARLGHDPEKERAVAAEELRRLALGRLARLAAGTPDV